MLPRKSQIIFLIICALLFTGIAGCSKKDKIDTNPALQLSFSADTISFDTVFTTIGSVTQKLLVYNNNENKVVVSSIQLARGSASLYRINFDGTAASSISDIEIPGHDSIFIFIRVTIDPNDENNPFIYSDSLLFITNGNLQDVKLVAYGQNANFYKDKTIEGTIVWDSLKPHVIYGFVRVDTGASLSILPGAKVYLHYNSYLVVSDQATLKLMGTIDHPVRFQGDRLDPFYRDNPGQWDGIYLEKGSKQNEISYAIIKNGIYGISIDSVSSSSSGPMLKIDNSIIQNMTGTGLSAYASSVISTNCVIGDCGGTALELTFGGNYDFRHLTIGNYWGGSVRLSPSLYLSNFTYVNSQKVFNALTNAYFGNCIIYGNGDEELLLDITEGPASNYTFDHGLIKTNNSVSDPLHYMSCLQNEDPRFLDANNYNYAIDSISPAIKKGIPMGVVFDINGVDRGTAPDLGAYQYVK
jgi:hypothetical protein